MSSIAFFGALELGLIYGIVAFGVFLTFRVLDFPDLTVESSFHWARYCRRLYFGRLGSLVGKRFGRRRRFYRRILTAFLAVHCGILHLLAGILIMIAGFSINIRIMGGLIYPCLAKTPFFPLQCWRF